MSGDGHTKAKCMMRMCLEGLFMVRECVVLIHNSAEGGCENCRVPFMKNSLHGASAAKRCVYKENCQPIRQRCAFWELL